MGHYPRGWAEPGASPACDRRFGSKPPASFSVDHEARYYLDPGSAFLYSAAGIDEVVTVDHLGLPAGTDVDAFDFARVPDDTDPPSLVLCMVLSVDVDGTLYMADENLTIVDLLTTPPSVTSVGPLTPTLHAHGLAVAEPWEGAVARPGRRRRGAGDSLRRDVPRQLRAVALGSRRFRPRHGGMRRSTALRVVDHDQRQVVL